MASTQVVLVANTVVVVPLDAPTGRVVISIASGTAAEVYATSDGSLPVVPVPGTEVSDTQQMLSSVLGGQIIMQPPLFGDHMAVGAIRLVSTGTPTVSVEW